MLCAVAHDIRRDLVHHIPHEAVMAQGQAPQVRAVSMSAPRPPGNDPGYMSKNSQFGDGVPEVKTQCFRGFQPRVHELLERRWSFAYYSDISFVRIYRNSENQDEKQQPPLCQVTVVRINDQIT